MRKRRHVMEPSPPPRAVMWRFPTLAARPEGVAGAVASPSAGWCAGRGGGAERRGLEGAA